jgi:hypothetical protein
MKEARGLVVLVVVVLGASLGLSARAEKEDTARAPQLDALKRLAGDWAGKVKHGEVEHDAAVSYKVTAGGSAVVETIFAGTEHEMVTIYHQDGDDLILTHYCMLGNQPRMRAERGGAANRLAFKFDGGANIKPEKTVHMHDMVLDLIDEDHVKATWTLYKDGKPGGTTALDLQRKPK